MLSKSFALDLLYMGKGKLYICTVVVRLEVFLPFSGCFYDMEHPTQTSYTSKVILIYTLH